MVLERSVEHRNSDTPANSNRYDSLKVVHDSLVYGAMGFSLSSAYFLDQGNFTSELCIVHIVLGFILNGLLNFFVFHLSVFPGTFYLMAGRVCCCYSVFTKRRAAEYRGCISCLYGLNSGRCHLGFAWRSLFACLLWHPVMLFTQEHNCCCSCPHTP